MSDLSNTPELQDELYNGREAPSPGAMLFTMLLLISGLLLTSMLMINHVSKAKMESGENVSGFSELIAQAKAMTARVESPQTVEPEAAPQSSTLGNFKKMVSTEKVRWPRLKLTGFGTSSDALESFAIINGDHVHPGQIVDKVTVVEVRAHDVVVEYMGEQKTLTVNVQD